MADERYILIRPPQLPELAEVGAGAYVVGYDSATDRTVKINVSALGGAEQVTDLSWRSNVEYKLNEIKEYGLKLWKSKIAGNQGNIPAENQYWTEVSKAGEGGGITNYATGVYTYTPAIVLRFEKLYRLAATLPFESTDFDAELEIGQWRLLNDSKIIGVAYGVGMTGNYTFVNLDDTLIVLNSGSVNSVKEGASPLTISLSEPSYIVKTGAGNTLSDFTILPIFGGGGSGHTILDPAGDTMPTQPVLQFGAGFTVTDEEGKTVVGLIFEETLIFRDIETFEFTKSQSFKITGVVSETGVTASIKLHGTNTDYVINDTVPAFNRLDISVDVLGAVTIKGILV